ncbi:MAG: hypothetical protein IJ353_01285 [Lachnospiraceae bacterium]|nr:hypothetical protein [Lachnospiraceae bacterium]
MKKKTSALAIVVAVIFSIILFPFILAGGAGASAVFTLESVIAPDREEDLYQSFVRNGGMDWGYNLVIEALDEGLKEGLAESLPEGMGDGAELLELDAKEILPRQQAETMVSDIYHAIVQGKEYQVDLSHQKDFLKTKLNEYFETTVTAEVKATVEASLEEEVKKEYGEAYDKLSESEKQEIMTKAKEEATKIALEEARNVFDTEVIPMVDTEVAELEQEVSEAFNSIYDMPEYKELKDLETRYGYSLTDRTALCKDISLAGYLLLGVTAFFLLLLLVCHWFRPSGFFTAGAFTLIIGGGFFAIAKIVPGVALNLLGSELSKMFMEGSVVSEVPGFVMPMLGEIAGWCLTGFEKVGKIGLMAAALFILVGILLAVIRNNKKETEPASYTEA